MSGAEMETLRTKKDRFWLFFSPIFFSLCFFILFLFFSLFLSLFFSFFPFSEFAAAGD